MKKLSVVIYDMDTTAIIAIIPNAFEESLDEIVLKNGYSVALIEEEDARIIDVNGVVMFIEDVVN